MDWARMLAYVTGTVDHELVARNEYLTAENRILKARLNGRLKLSDAERSTLGEIGHRLGRTALAEVATVAKPDTILARYRKLAGHKRLHTDVPSPLSVTSMLPPRPEHRGLRHWRISRLTHSLSTCCQTLHTPQLKSGLRGDAIRGSRPDLRGHIVVDAGAWPA
jgi:hypothetical protein